MFKSIMAILSIMIVVYTFSGCASKPMAISSGKYKTAPQLLIKVNNGAGVPSWGHNEKIAFANALESAATATLKRGYRYFAIVKPDVISNINGSILNTAQEILDKCLPSSANVLNIGNAGLHKCGTYNTKASLLIALYNSNQTDFTVFDAKKVLDYLKQNDLYEGIEPQMSE